MKEFLSKERFCGAMYLGDYPSYAALLSELCWSCLLAVKLDSCNSS